MLAMHLLCLEDQVIEGECKQCLNLIECPIVTKIATLGGGRCMLSHT
jgi:hypothetical protein